MTNDLHLNAETSGLAVPDDREGRVAWLEARYFKNQRDEAFQDCLREILVVGADGMILPEPVRSPLNGETSGMRVIGATGSGKSVMIRRNLTALPGFVKSTKEIQGNHIDITVSPSATIKSLASDILEATGYVRPDDKVKAHEAWAMVRHRLREAGIALLWIDEVHQLLRGGPGNDPVMALQTLKNLLQGHGAVAVILSGVPELEQRLSKDDETYRRYQLQLRLRPLVEGQAEIRRFEKFLRLCCSHLALDWPSDPAFAERIAFSQHGALGESTAFAKSVIRRTLHAGRKELTLEEAHRLWVLRGGNADGLSPFDPQDWSKLSKKLRPPVEAD
ncbi:ATP-binding protein [Falsigemmobacter faecalis]|uniref:AAA family ATPase n=1 Tax=Falsigemmobacter faecalis TaxID=2488730 RepID=A0A3P3DT69_9RHOB|nr:ATP-binding protein [Falsigemmobacter faecalis]RRH77399.1 hypothetical protein EG244_04185 [Falsigemmobacter faecalis]